MLTVNTKDQNSKCTTVTAYDQLPTLLTLASFEQMTSTVVIVNSHDPVKCLQQSKYVRHS